jgi:hypothetical protein
MVVVFNDWDNLQIATCPQSRRAKSSDDITLEQGFSSERNAQK